MQMFIGLIFIVIKKIGGIDDDFGGIAYREGIYVH